MEPQPETELANENEYRQRFTKLLADIFQSYDGEARKQELNTKYPTLSPDEMVDRLISIASRKASAVGGSTGAVTTAAWFTTFPSGGAGAALLLGVIGAEVLYLVRLQIELVLDISLLYGIEIEQHPSLPALVGAGNISIEVLEATLKNPTLVLLARVLSQVLPSRLLLKYSLPALSVVIGGGYNYVTVKGLGRLAKSYLQEKGEASESRMLEQS